MYQPSYIFLHPLTTGQRHSNLFKLACEASRRRYPQEAILRGITPYFEQSDFPISELKGVLSSGYKQVKERKSENAPNTASLHDKDKKTKKTYSTPKMDEDANEAYWQGEEYRKKTPSFSKNLYDNLPDLLNDCICLNNPALFHFTQLQ